MRTPSCSRPIRPTHPVRTIRACDSLLIFYNRGIALGLATKDIKEVDLSERQLSLPFGSLSVGIEPEGFNYGGSHLTKFASLADLDVRGLQNTYRRPGIGAALSARVEPTPCSPGSRWISASAKVPIHRVRALRRSSPRDDQREVCMAQWNSTTRTGRVFVQVGTQSVPLESES